MGPSVPVSVPALWVLGCFSLLLWLWVLCTACHRKQVQSHQPKLQDTVMLAESARLRQTHLRSLSISDTRLHELHCSTRGSKALRPASMDLLHSHWLEISRSSSRSQAAPPAFPRQRQLTEAHPAPAITLSIGPGATYSNVRLPAIPRASLAASPVVWAGTQLTTGCDQPGFGTAPLLAEYASIQKLKGTDLGSQELQQGKAKVLPSAQVDNLYSRVSKPKMKDLRSTTDHPDCKGTGAVLALESDFTYEPLPLRGLGMDSSPQENVYESIREMGTPGRPEPPIMPVSRSGHSRPTRPLRKVETGLP